MVLYGLYLLTVDVTFTTLSHSHLSIRVAPFFCLRRLHNVFTTFSIRFCACTFCDHLRVAVLRSERKEEEDRRTLCYCFDAAIGCKRNTFPAVWHASVPTYVRVCEEKPNERYKILSFFFCCFHFDSRIFKSTCKITSICSLR